MIESPVSLVRVSRREEWANVLTHGLGALAAAAVGAVLLMAAGRGGEPWRVVTLSIFVAALLVVLVVSTLYHAVSEPAVKRWLRKLDHAMIFVLIAGTYTPLMLVTLVDGGRGGWGWSLFGIVWGLAAVGLTLKLACFDRFGWLGLGLTLVMGWLIVIAAEPVVSTLSGAGLLWLAGGGLAYTLGVVFFLWERLPYHHAVWHALVLTGGGCHVMVMFREVVPGG